MITLLIMSVVIFLNFWSWRNKNILLTFAASLSWLTLAMWAFFSTTPILGLGETYQTLLVWIFFMMTFVPLLLHIQVEVKKEIRGKDGTIFSWKDNGGIPKRAPFGTADQYRLKLRERIGNAQGRKTKSRRVLYGK